MESVFVQVTSVSVYNQNNLSAKQPNFGRVIKSRFFEVMPDGKKRQVQDVDLINGFCKRLTYHLSEPWKEKKNRLPAISRFLKSVDSDYATMPLVRRILNLNRP